MFIFYYLSMKIEVGIFISSSVVRKFYFGISETHTTQTQTAQIKTNICKSHTNNSTYTSSVYVSTHNHINHVITV